MSVETYWLVIPLILLGVSGFGWLWLWITSRHPSAGDTSTRDLRPG